MVTLDDFLKALSTTHKAKLIDDKILENTKETWSRIGKGDDFRELAFKSDSEKDEFLADWVENNPYSNI